MAVRYEITVNQRQLASLRKKLEPKQYAKILFGIARKAASIGAQEIRSQHWDIGATTRATIFESTSFGARIAMRSSPSVEIPTRPRIRTIMARG